VAGHDNWLTPPDLYALLHAEFGFDLDACASIGHEKCAHAITPDENALVTPWRGRRVWCNPPYSLIAEFVYRAWEQSQAQRSTVVLLIPAYTDPAYWYDCIVPHADEIRFLCGRVSFLENGNKKTSARFPSVVVVFRWRSGEFKKPPHIWWWKWRQWNQKPRKLTLGSPVTVSRGSPRPELLTPTTSA
jgi:phage N-6-adenine-methyltransferase